MRGFLTLAVFAILGGPVAAQAQHREPIIDMHMHASAADEQGPPPLAICTPMDPMPVWDQSVPWVEALIGYFKHPPCPDPIWSR